MGANWAPGASPGGSQNAPGGPRGRKKVHCYLPGGLRRNFPARFHPPRGSRGALWASFWEPLGLILALRLAIGVENAKMSIFANSPHENLDFEGSGGLPGTIFGAKNRSRNKLEAKTARTHVPEPPKSLPERSWRASGGEKKTLVTSKSGLGKFSSHFFATAAHLGFGAFFLKIAGASAGCKNRGVQGFRGHSWGWGEKLKLLQQQASLLFKASLRDA